LTRLLQRVPAANHQTERLEQRLRDGATGLGLALTDPAIRNLIAYVALLQRWNRVFNLTGARNSRDIINRHVLDSLSGLPFIGVGPALDVGTGAGLPGLVLACARPDQSWVLLDSSAKKTRFLNQAVIELNMSNVVVVRSRLDDYAPRQPFGTITVRAVGTLASSWRHVKSWLREDGSLVAYKGKFPEEELAELASEQVSAEVHRIELPGVIAERHMVIVRRFSAWEVAV
jgi:16S rRNA (guanine527-N7)-methyltransferase